MAADTIHTAEEYLAIERASEERSELVNGRIRPRARSSLPHVVIMGNIAAHAHARLRDESCSVLTAAMRVKVSRTGMYAYPDVVAFCGPPELEDPFEDTLLNPEVIVEVYSDETEAFDRGEKFIQYLRSDTLREYILVAQDEVRVERYLRDGDGWLFSEITDPAGMLRIETLGCEIALGEIYARVEFPASAPVRG
jgi:Uma2 family endonuclease